jgi:hypothetical protein
MLAIKNTRTGEVCRGVFYTADECHVYARSQGFTAYEISKNGKVVETVDAA